MTTGTVSPQRMFASFQADITVREDHTDELTITEHPVEQGAAITDHAYKRPAKLVLQLGWSNASPAAGGSDSYVRDIYAKLLALQAARTVFDVTTGKRSYTNMLAASVAMTTDETTEWALFVTIVCQEIIIVQTSTAAVPPASAHSDPQQTAPVVNEGTKQPIPATLSPPSTPVPGQ